MFTRVDSLGVADVRSRNHVRGKIMARGGDGVARDAQGHGLRRGSTGRTGETEQHCECDGWGEAARYSPGPRTVSSCVHDSPQCVVVTIFVGLSHARYPTGKLRRCGTQRARRPNELRNFALRVDDTRDRRSTVLGKTDVSRGHTKRLHDEARLCVVQGAEQRAERGNR